MADKPQRVRVEAPAGMDAIDVAHELLVHASKVVELHRQTKAARSKRAKKKDSNATYASRVFRRHDVMRQLNRAVMTAYDRQMERMLGAMWKYLETARGLKLRKSDSRYGFVADVDWPDDDLIAKQSDDQRGGPFPEAARRFGEVPMLTLLTPEQLERLKQIIKDYHAGFAVGVLGADSIPAAEVQRLMDLGVIPQDLAYVFQPRAKELPPTAIRFTDVAFRYGQALTDPDRRDDVQTMGLPGFVDSVAERPLSAVEKQAMAWARRNAGEHIRGAGDRGAMEVSTTLMNEDGEQRRRYLGVVREKTEEAIEQRKTWRKLASEIGHATKDWSRDMQRLAATEKQWAMQEGQVAEIRKKHPKKEIHVFKQPAPDACPDCVRLHLTAGPGSTPRVFLLSELQGNGTNVGKKRNAWQAVVGPVHPWCGCELHEMPEGWSFDESGNLAPELAIDKSLGSSLKKADGKGQTESVRPHMTHGKLVPDDTVVVRVSDPRMRAVIENVVAEAPKEIFHKDVGVTLITTDTARVQNPLDDHDFAYWTGNEIRVMQTLPIERLPRVIRHELGHTLNVHLMKQLGSVEKVRRWHDQLWEVSQREGWVSDYAKKLPIENAAEVTRMYLFEKPTLMLNFPLQFAFCLRAYRDIFRKRPK